MERFAVLVMQDRLDRQSNKVRDVKKNYGKMSNEENTSKERNKL